MKIHKSTYKGYQIKVTEKDAGGDVPVSITCLPEDWFEMYPNGFQVVLCWPPSLLPDCCSCCGERINRREVRGWGEQEQTLQSGSVKY